ncbi:MAG: zinc metalloprotease [Planctomycetota bacterium]|jgi:stage IV sporulation protein FB
MISLPMGRLTLRIHVGLAVIAIALVLLGGDLWVRYLILLGVLLLHEMAHALTCLAVRGRQAIVSLWPWGGVAHVERFSDAREAVVALAGPFANLAAALVFAFAGGEFTLALGRCSLTDLAFTCNLLMGLANLLPLPRLDGGCALRILARRFPR